MRWLDKLLQPKPKGPIYYGAAGGTVIAYGDNAGQIQGVTPTTPLPVAIAPLTSETVTSVANSLTNVTLLPANASRRACKIYNDGTAGNLLVKHGATASATSFTVRIAPGGYYEMPRPVYTGQTDGLWDATGSAARITEGV